MLNMGLAISYAQRKQHELASSFASRRWRCTLPTMLSITHLLSSDPVRAEAVMLALRGVIQLNNQV